MLVVHTEEPGPYRSLARPSRDQEVTNGCISLLSAKANRWLERMQVGTSSDQQRREKRARRKYEHLSELSHCRC